MADFKSQKLSFMTTPSSKRALASAIAAELDKRKIYAAARCSRADLIAQVARQLKNKEDGFVTVDDLWVYFCRKAL